MTLPTGTVTFLFTDIEGSTGLAQQYPDRWDDLRQRHHAILQSAMEAQNGYVFQIIGDAFCVAFHTVRDGLCAAIESQRALITENWGENPIKVRMGLHTGAAELQGTDYRGYMSMARVQRVMSTAYGGQILLSNASAELIRGELPEGVALRDMQENRLKGLLNPERLWQVIVPDLPQEFPPLKTLNQVPNNLPVQLTSFIGREREIREVVQSLSQHRLVTLTGPGGTGKTRLSLQVAAEVMEQFPDGSWFIELVSLTDPNLISYSILTALHYGEQPGRTHLQILEEQLGDKKLLLILDNCEHLVEASAKVARALLTAAPEIRILASSREPLTVNGELVWQVSSLALPDPQSLPEIEQLTQYEAVRLFIERACLVQPRFTVDATNAPAIAQICFRLDGIPLAIELAAARVKALAVEQIAKRLDDRFRLLTGGSRTVLERHQTLRAALDWSYNLLSEQEKVLFCRLSVFSSGWTLEAAEQVCAGENDISSGDVLDLLIRLIDKSLVLMSRSRYQMLETTRQYALEKLTDLSESEWVQNRHLDFFMKLAEEAEARLVGEEQMVWLERLESEQDNLRAALKWGLESNAEAGLRLVSALWLFWFMHAHFIEGRQWYDKALAVDRTGSPHLMRLLIGAASNALGRDDLERMAAFSEQSLVLARDHENDWGIAMSLHHLGSVAARQGDYERAENLLGEGLALSREKSNWPMTSILLDDLGRLAAARGDYETAFACSQEALSICEKYGNRWGSSYDLQFMAFIAYDQKEYSRSRALFQKAIPLAYEFQDRRHLFYLFIGIAMVALAQGQLERAARMMGVSEILAHTIGFAFTSDEQELLAALRQQLGEERFEAFTAEGRGMTIEQAVLYALGKNNE